MANDLHLDDFNDCHYRTTTRGQQSMAGAGNDTGAGSKAGNVGRHLSEEEITKMEEIFWVI